MDRRFLAGLLIGAVTLRAAQAVRNTYRLYNKSGRPYVPAPDYDEAARS